MAIVSMAIVSTAELARRAVRIYVHSTHLYLCLCLCILQAHIYICIHIYIYVLSCRYVDACTHVLCYATPLRAPLHAFCAARRDGKRAPRRAAPAVVASAAAASAAASADSEGCAAVRRLYREDWALYQAHCLSPQ